MRAWLTKPTPFFGFFNAFAVQALFWVVSLLQTHRHGMTVVGVIDIVGLAWSILNLIWVAHSGRSVGVLAGSLAVTFSLLLADFSWFYWESGGSGQFSHPLTHLDAVYFAIGTLSTAGTGNLAAISQGARALQSIQMVLDMLLVGGAVALVLGRIIARPPRVPNTGS